MKGVMTSSNANIHLKHAHDTVSASVRPWHTRDVAASIRAVQVCRTDSTVRYRGSSSRVTKKNNTQQPEGD